MQGERAHERDPLAHAAGERVRIVVEELAEPVAAREQPRLLPGPAASRRGSAAPRTMLPDDRPPRDQEILLEHVADVPRLARHVPAVDEDAPGVRALRPDAMLKSVDFPASGRPDDRDELGAPDLEAEIVERERAVEAHGDVVDDDLGLPAHRSIFAQ